MSFKSVENHPQRAEIIMLLRNSQITYGQIVRRIGSPIISTSALRNYAKKKLPALARHPAISDRAAALELGAAISDIENADMVLEVAQGEALTADERSVPDLLSVAKGRRDQAQARGKLGGWLTEKHEVNTTADLQSRQMLIADLAAALDPIPGGITALESVLMKHSDLKSAAASTIGSTVIDG
jgi:hypothetical protein